jgi:hypothetical protein
MVGFRNNFQDHRRLSEQLLESQAAIGKPEQDAWRGLQGFGVTMPLIFVYFSYFMTYIHSFNHIHPSSFAEVSLHIFIAGKLSGKNLPVVPSRESISGLPYSKPTRYQLSHAAP